MKSLFRFAMVASAVIAAAACNKVVDVPESSVKGEKVTLSASREDLSSGTKTLLQSDLSVWWNTGEEISVFYGSGTNGGSQFSSQNTEPSATAEFSGTVDATGVAPESDYWAVYPYMAENSSDGTSVQTDIPLTQNAVEGNFADNGFPAVAKSKDLNMSFKNICGALKFSLTRDDITSVTFESNGGESLAGTVTVEMDTEGIPETTVVTGSPSVVLANPDGSPLKAGVFYYINIIPTALATGFTMTFDTPSGSGVFVTDKNLAIKRSVVSLIRNADSYATFASSAVTIKDFAQELVTILDVWENTTGTIDMLKGEAYEGGEWNVADAHYVPDATTITVGGKTYTTADMFETAIRSYLLVRGYNGLDTESYGKNSISALSGGAQAMSTTPVPETHGYYWGASPYNETTGNGGHFVLGTKDENEHCKIKLDALDNWAMRSLNYQHGQAITNLCGYSGGQLSGYYGCFCSKRALLTYTFFFKYMLDNDLDKADAIDASTIFRTELFGDETPAPAPIELKAQWLFSAAAALDATTGYAQTWGGANKYKSSGAWDGTEGYAYFTAGDGGRYIDAQSGPGRITYVQEDKSGMTNNGRAARTVGSTGHPYSTGIWYGDYWLFTLDSPSELPAGTKIHIKYIARSSTAGPKYFMGEYFDAGEWKIATMEVIESAYNFATPVEATLKDRNGDDETFSYNIKMKEDGSKNTTVESYFVLTTPTSKIQYRQRVTGLYRSSDGTTAITGLGTATTRLAGSDELRDDGTYSSPLIEVVN